MAASRRTINELAKARELLRHLLRGKLCFFCHDPLLTAAHLEGHKPGSGRGRPLVIDITEHHLDGNHENDDPENLDLSHGCCHRRFHLAERRAAERAARAAQQVAA